MQDASSSTSMSRFIGRQASIVCHGSRDESQRYLVMRKIGEGGYGAVFEAKDTFHGEKSVAIKSINLAGLSATEMIEATDGFNREVRMLTGLHHPHLPRVYDHFTDPAHWYLVMDYIAGETLEEYLEQQRRGLRARVPGGNPGGLLPVSEVFEIMEQLCSVLNYLHSQQPPVIFRDLKPGNIMRTPSGHLYLIDFGIARRFKPGQAKDTIPLGSPGYAAPEQYGKQQTDQRADIYSLGALLHFLLTGDDPSENAFSFAPLPDLPAELAGLERLLTSMLALDPNQRPGDILAVTRALNALRMRPVINRPNNPIVQPQSTAYYIPGGGQQQQRKKMTRRLVLGGALVLGVAGLANARTIAQVFQSPAGMRSSPASVSQVAGQLTGELKEGIPETGTIPTKMVWAPDGTAIALYQERGLESMIPHIQVQNLATHQLFSLPSKLLASPPNYLYGVEALVWQEYLVVGRNDKTVLVWDVEKQALVRELPSADPASASALAAGPRGGMIAMSTGQGVYLWSVQDPRLSHQLFNGDVKTRNEINALEISPGGFYIAANSIDRYHMGKLSVWSTSSKYEQMFSWTFDADRGKAAIAMSWSVNDLLACVSGDGLVSCFSTRGEMLWQRNLGWPSWQAEATVSWSPDGCYLVVTTPDRPGLSVWDAQGGEIKIDIKESNKIKHAVWNPRKRPVETFELAVTKVDDGIEIWKIEQG